jgi:hypothetical protein
VILGYFVALVGGNWKDFKTALLATGMTLSAFAMWHLLRVPFLLHRSVHAAGDTSDPGFLSGVFGVIVIVCAFTGAYRLGAELWNAKPLGEITSSFPSADPGAVNSQIDQLTRENAQLKREKEAQSRHTSRPIVVENKIDVQALIAAIDNVVKQRGTALEQSPLKKKTLQLSQDILNFVLVRSKSAPKMKMTQTREEGEKAWEERGQFSEDIKIDYMTKFGSRVEAISQELRAAGVRIESGGRDFDWNCWQRGVSGDLSEFQSCGVELGAAAEQMK